MEVIKDNTWLAVFGVHSSPIVGWPLRALADVPSEVARWFGSGPAVALVGHCIACTRWHRLRGNSLARIAPSAGRWCHSAGL